jgi:transketolase
MAGELPENWQSKLPLYTPTSAKEATRKSSGVVLNALAEAVPELIGGSADLTPSNLTALKCTTDFSPSSPQVVTCTTLLPF